MILVARRATRCVRVTLIVAILSLALGGLSSAQLPDGLRLEEPRIGASAVATN